MKIVIVYELPQRELENDLLLKSYLESLGISCDIVKFPYRNIIELRRKYMDKVDLVIVHSLYDDKVINHLVYSVFGMTKYIINMQVEQIGTNKSENDVNSYGRPKGSAKYGFHVCWGIKSKRKMESCGIAEDHILQTGPIQMDFLRKEFEDYYYTREEILDHYGIDGNKKIALFISSFSYVGLPEYAKKELKGKIGIERFESFEKLSEESLIGISSWFAKYLQDNKDIIIVYRKHPAENLSEEVLNLKDMYPDNFLLISDYSVKQWIMVSDMILTWYSTSVAEAYYAKKSVLVLRPVTIDKDNDVTILNNIRPIDSYEEFVKSISSGNYFSNLDDGIMNSYFDVDEKIPSYARLGDMIIGILNSQDTFFPWSRYDTKKYDRINRINRIKSVLYKPYKITLLGLEKIQHSLKIKLPINLTKRIENQAKERAKIANQNEEIIRLTQKADMFDAIISRF